MKKTLALILAIVMMAALAVPAFAETGTAATAEKTTDAGYSSTANVTYGVSKTYTVNLPTSIEFGNALSVPTAVSASNVVIAGNEKLTVTLQSDFLLSCTNCDDVEYWVWVLNEDATEVTSEPQTRTNVKVLDVPASDTVTPAGDSQNITFGTLGTSQAGQYSDIITFVIAIETVAP